MNRFFNNTKITVEFDESETRQQLSSGDSLKTLFRKIKKWLSDLKPVALSGSYNDLTDVPVVLEDQSVIPNERFNLGSSDKEWKEFFSDSINVSTKIRLDNVLSCVEKNYGPPDQNDFYCTIGNGLTPVCNTLVIGHFNSTAITSADRGGYGGYAFQIGNGGHSKGSDAFRVAYHGAVYAHDSYNTINADYAEYLEWKDKNPGGEDRVGKFVTLSFDKIQIANQGDFICGIISGHPSVVGNHDFDEWVHKYKTDEFGRLVYDDNGRSYALNENYDDSLVYVPRSDRPEWDAVGMLGILRVYDDGTCVPDGYCKVADSGTATSAQALENSFLTPVFKVMKRVSPNVIEIFFK